MVFIGNLGEKPYLQKEKNGMLQTISDGILATLGLGDSSVIPTSGIQQKTSVVRLTEEYCQIQEGI